MKEEAGNGVRAETIATDKGRRTLNRLAPSIETEI
jgi:hypothetical protein